MKEVCSCQAEFEYVRVEGMVVTDEWLERVYEMLKDWRASHIHEMPPAPVEMPLIHESGSSHERVVDEYPIQDRATIGFTRNEVR